MLVIDIDNPSRDLLEQMIGVSRLVQRPVAMFVDQSDASMMQAAVDAGISADVVDGLRPACAEGVLVGGLFLGPASEPPAYEAAKAFFATESLEPAARRALLSGRAEGVATGPTVGVGALAIADAIRGGCRSAEAVGGALDAGTNCGSCLPEIRRMIADIAALAA